MENYEDNKKTIEEFKEIVLNYFKENRDDVTIKQLYEDLNLKINDLNLLEYLLDELVENKLIKKEKSIDHLEYDLMEGEE